MRVMAALLLYLLGSAAVASELRPFTNTSKAAIERAHAGQPFVLAFWSLDCTYCGQALQHLRRMIAAYPSVKLVLVSTDGAEFAEAASTRLNNLLASAPAERWIYSGDSAEHLSFAVDRKWRGELPRSYFYAATGQAHAVSGSVSPQRLDAWAKACAAAPACTTP